MTGQDPVVTDRVVSGIDVDEVGPPGQPGSGPGGPRGAWARLLWAAGLVVAGVLLFWFYLRMSRTDPANADAAGQVLQGWDMMHGNPLLRGWFLGDVTYYTFEIPLDGLIAMVDGLRAEVVHISGALIYTLLVLTAALLAKGRARGSEGAVRAVLAAGVLLAPGLYPGVHVLLTSADHTGIAVPVMLTLLVVDRGRERWYTPVVAGVLLTWAQLDDPVATYACALPLAAVCAVRAAAAFLTRRGGRKPDGALPVPRYDAALAVAAVASYGLTGLVTAVISGAGGFYTYPLATGLAKWSVIPTQLLWTWQNVLYLFGANHLHQPTALAGQYGYLHLIGVGVGLCGLAIGLWGLFFRLGRVFGPGPSGRADRITQALTVGTVVIAAAGAFGTHMTPVQGSHEIAIVLPLSAVLGGRLLGPWLAGVGGTRDSARSRRRTAARSVRLTAAAVLAVAGVGYLAALGYGASRPAKPAVTQDLADWLVGHHLTSGLAGYWEANSTTLAGNRQVLVAPLANGGSYGDPWESEASWYSPTASYANFVVTITSGTLYPSARYARPSVVLTWYGKPEHTYIFGRYTIMVYGHNLLTRVQPPVAGQL
jgi:hypothetical protein